MTHSYSNRSNRQRGAALVIGLMLLVILTLLAVAGMNTASTELAMAGNEQYQLKALQASQSGIEQALTVVGTSAGPETTANATVAIPATAVTGSGGDEYSGTMRYMGPGTVVSGYSINKYAVHQFQVESTGTSARNSRIRTVQGVFTVQGKASSEY